MKGEIIICTEVDTDSHIKNVSEKTTVFFKKKLEGIKILNQFSHVS